MAKLTWRGPDDYEAGETPPSSLTWAGITFPVGAAVEVDNPWMIAKARGNRLFRVDGNGKPPAIMPETWTNDPPPPIDEPPRYPVTPPDYPPEDEPERKPNKRRGRPKRIRDNGDGIG